MDLDILERRVPVTEENPEKSKRGLYKIKDNYLRFWFAFIYPNMSFIESGHSGIAVSYTHLDVYKRQPSGPPLSTFLYHRRYHE